MLYCTFFFFNDTATTEIYTLSLHDALPIYAVPIIAFAVLGGAGFAMTQSLQMPMLAEHVASEDRATGAALVRSEEHTSELQSRQYLVCRLLLEKKKCSDPDPAHLLHLHAFA